ncbi:MAG TPA: hypothetical protein VHT24_10530 [Pseudacidobacterium sp.]|nr:hypothetical protein [Pseudacidobacterium sp.]
MNVTTKSAIDLTFPHSWTVEVLEKHPMIVPARQFVYPQRAEEVERGALELLIHPKHGEKFLATCAMGFADPTAPTGVWSCPDPDWLCAVSGGYAYLINSLQPEQWSMIPYRPVLGVRALAEQRLLLFVGHYSILAWGCDGQAWQSERLSWEGVEITDIVDNTLCGLGWDLITDKDVPFAIDLKTGEHTGGIATK